MSDHQRIAEFTAHLRSIEGLRLFKIFSKYTAFKNIMNLFNFLAAHESEETLRELEHMWEEFVKEEEQKDKNI
jgi:hypothetical protein